MSNIDESDRLTFWRNWYEAIRYKPEKERLEKYDALLAYVFDGVEPPKPSAESPESANAYEIVNFVRATVEISRKRRQIGSRGGVAEKQNGSKREAKRKQNGSKTQANPNQEQEQEQEQVQEQEQEHNAISYSATAHAKKQPTIKQFVEGGKLAGVPEDFSRPFYADLVAAGWADKEGRYVANWRRYLKTAYLDEKKKISAARDKAGYAITLDDIPMA